MSNLKAQWTNVLKSGSKATQVVRDAILHTVEHGDSSLLAHMILAADKADMKVYSKRVRLIVGATFEGAKIKKTKDGGYAISGATKATLNDAALAALDACVQENYSLIGIKIGEVFGEVKAEVSAEEELAKRAKSAAQWIAKTDGVSVEQYISMVRAEYAQAIALTAVAA